MTEQEHQVRTYPILTDENGTFELSGVHAVTPFKVDHNPKTNTHRVVAVLHHSSGHSLQTNTDYATVRKMVFDPVQ